MILELAPSSEYVTENTTYEQIFEGTDWVTTTLGGLHYLYSKNPWDGTVSNLSVVTAVGFDVSDDSIQGIIDGYMLTERVWFIPRLTGVSNMSQNFVISNITQPFNKTDAFSTLTTTELKRGSRSFQQGVAQGSTSGEDLQSTTKHTSPMTMTTYGILFELKDILFDIATYNSILAVFSLGDPTGASISPSADDTSYLLAER